MYRIMTENKDLPKIERLLSDLGLDFTAYQCKGCWHGTLEESLVLDFVADSFDAIMKAAEEIRTMNEQEAVYVQKIPEETWVVEKK